MPGASWTMPSYGVKPRPPPRPSRAERAGEPVVQIEQVAGAAARAGGAGDDEGVEARQVVLHRIDGARGIVRRRPRQTRPAGLGGLALERLRVGDDPGEGAPDLHRVERRDAGPRLEQLDARVGQIRAPGRGAHSQPQQQALVAGPVVLDGELGAEALPERVEEDGVLAGLLGKDALGQAGDEHDVELSPPRVLERADEHLPVAGGRRPLGDGGELVAQHVAHLVEGHRPDGAERAELRQHGQHALRAPEHGGGEGLEVADPLRPGGGGGQRRQRVDHRQGEAREVLEVGEVPLDRREARGVRLLLPQLFEPEAHLRGESLQPAHPPLAAADHRRVDEEPLPLPRRTERPLENGRGVAVRVWRSARLRRAGHRLVSSTRGGSCREGQLVIVGGHPGLPALGRRAAWIEGRHLAEGQVLREAARGELLERAVQQHQEGAARRIRAPRAPGEERGDARPPERGLEQRGVDLRRPQQDRDPIEGRAGPRLFQDPPCDLDRLAPLPGSGEEDGVPGDGGGGGRDVREQVGAKMGESRGVIDAGRDVHQRLRLSSAGSAGATDSWGRLGGGCQGPLRLGSGADGQIAASATDRRVGPRAELEQGLAGAFVAGRHRGQDRRRLRGERGNEPSFRRRGDRDIEQNDGQSGERYGRPPHGRAGQLEQRGAVRQRRTAPREHRLEAGQELAHVLARRAHRPDAARFHTGEPDLRQRGRQRSGEAGELRDRCQVAERSGLHRVEGDPRGEGLGPERGRRRGVEPGEIRRSDPGGQLEQAGALDPESCAGGPGDDPHQLVGSIARRPHDERLARPGQGNEVVSRHGQPLGGEGRLDELDHAHKPKSIRPSGIGHGAPLDALRYTRACGAQRHRAVRRGPRRPPPMPPPEESQAPAEPALERGTVTRSEPSAPAAILGRTPSVLQPSRVASRTEVHR